MRTYCLRLARGLSGLALLLFLADCGGGGGGGGSSPEGPPPTIVSGSVQAPGGQVAFYREQGLFQRLADLFSLSAYAAVSGLGSVPDGTQVELGRTDSAGVVTRIATTTTSGGKYSFNLTSLGLGFSSDLVVRVVNTGTGAQMRAFVAGATVNLDPVSESAVRMILDKIAASPGTGLSNFTPQELGDLVGGLDLLTTINQAAGGLTIESTVATIRQHASADAGLMAFLTAAAGTGETTDGPGDIGNYYPLAQDNVWRVQGTKSKAGQQASSFVNSARVAGTKSLGGLTALVLAETNPDASGLGIETYLIKDSRGVTVHGNNDATDPVTPRVIPFTILRFPLQAGTSFEAINKTGLNLGDLDGDGKSETGAVLAQVTVVAFESVTVPIGTFANSARIETKISTTVTLSSDGSKVTVLETDTEWFAPGIGPVKRQAQITDQNPSETSEELAGYFVGGQGKGMVSLTAATAGAGEVITGKSGLASDGQSYLLVSCRSLGSSPGIFGAFVSGVTAGAPFLIASGDCSSLGGTSENSISQPSAAFDGTNYLVVFVKGAIIRGIRVSQLGTVLDGPSGFAISTGQLFSISNTSPTVAFDGANYLVVWNKFIPIVGVGTRNVFGATVTPAGQVSAEIPISAEQNTSPSQLGFTFDLGAPSLAFDGTNYLAVFNKVRLGPGSTAFSDVLGARVSTQGVVLDPQGILISTSQSAVVEDAKVAFDGTNYLAVWRRASTNDDPSPAQVRGTRISQDGTLLDGPPSGGGIAINTTVLGKSGPVLAFDGTNFLVAWVVGAFPNSPPAGIFGAKVSPGGQVVAGLPATNGLPLSEPPASGRFLFPAMSTNGANVLLTWFDNTQASGQANSLPATLIFP